MLLRRRQRTDSVLPKPASLRSGCQGPPREQPPAARGWQRRRWQAHPRAAAYTGAYTSAPSHSPRGLPLFGSAGFEVPKAAISFRKNGYLSSGCGNTLPYGKKTQSCLTRLGQAREDATSLLRGMARCAPEQHHPVIIECCHHRVKSNEGCVARRGSGGGVRGAIAFVPRPGCVRARQRPPTTREPS